jgi:hypothetical protein
MVVTICIGRFDNSGFTSASLIFLHPVQTKVRIIIAVKNLSRFLITFTHPKRYGTSVQVHRKHSLKLQENLNALTVEQYQKVSGNGK